jgi:hypothetical protein
LENVLKAIVTAGAANVLTNNLVIALCAGWAIYLFEKQKEDKSGTLT